MSDGSATLLAELLLEPGCETVGGVNLLAGQLAADPPLAVWVLIQAACRTWQWPRTVAEAAAWLDGHLFEALQWHGPQDAARETVSGDEAERWGNRVLRAIHLAHLAAQLAAPQGEATAQAAFLEGLTCGAADWFADGCGESLREVIDGSDPGPGATWAAQAVEIIDGRGQSPEAECGLEACRQRAVEGQRRWLEPLPSVGRLLPVLAARIVRLQQLEHRFQETLETEKLESLAEFAAGAGHEINNPLAVIAGRAQLLLRQETDPERQRELASINAQALRANEMIADLRLFARPPRLEPKATDMVELVDGVIADLAPQAAERSVELARVGRRGPLEAEVDPVQLRVALHALCRNSLEAIGRDGRIEIALECADPMVRVRVCDDGPGIPARHRRHLFDPFYSSRQAGRGLGLGLSKCWRIVTLHGGRIEVAGGPDRGALFTLILPRKRLCHTAERSDGSPRHV